MNLIFKFIANRRLDFIVFKRKRFYKKIGYAYGVTYHHLDDDSGHVQYADTYINVKVGGIVFYRHINHIFPPLINNRIES